MAATVVEFLADPAKDLVATLTARATATGTPNAAGYPVMEVDDGQYRFTVVEALVGEFDLVIDEVGQGQFARFYVTLDDRDEIYRAYSEPRQPAINSPALPGVGLRTGTPEDIDNIGSIIEPETSSPNGCTDPRQQAAYIVPAGPPVGLSWTVRDAAGNPIEALHPDVFAPVPIGATANLGGDFAVLDDTPAVELSFADGDFAAAVEIGHEFFTYEIDADDSLEDLTASPTRLALLNNPFCHRPVYVCKLQIRDGKLLIIPPREVMQRPSIYNLEVRWQNPPASEVYIGSGLVSVEQSLLNRGASHPGHGPLPLSRIRNVLRDYAALNDVSGVPEFSVEEIVRAMLEPIEYYNEAPPHVQTFTVDNFPYRQQWTDATVGRLLQTAGLWMQRNQVTIQATGIGSDERGKYQSLIKQGAFQWQQYKDFVHKDKVRINVTRGFRII